MIAEFDATENEAENLEVPGFPTIMLYQKGKKSMPLEYEGDRKMYDMRTFLWENSEAYKAYFPEKPVAAEQPEPYHQPEEVEENKPEMI